MKINKNEDFIPFMGLVVIGLRKDNQGKGIGGIPTHAQLVRALA